MPTANLTLNVQGEAVGIAWSIIATVNVEDPAGSGNWRKARLSEVDVKLYEERWGILPDVFLGEGVTSSLGVVNFAYAVFNLTSTRYKVHAFHRASGSSDGLFIQLNDDGTVDILSSYKP
ncbi:hypothetical protein ES705_16964 [subsurface metagenome]